MKKIGMVDSDLVVYEAAFCAQKKEDNGEYLNWYQVSQIVDTIMRRILKGSKATHHLGFITHSGSNFRLKRATTLPYKGTRKTNEKREKPVFYEEIREYLQKHWGNQMMRGVEADDALTIASEHFKDNPKVTTLIATKDKDLWQYPGEHYNMNTKELMTISPAEAHKNLWRQMILGDIGTDNIPGLSYAYKEGISFLEEKGRHYPIPEHMFGKVAANKILDSVDPKEYAKVIYELYVDAYWEHGMKDDLPEQRFYECFDLVWMLRSAPKDLKIHFNPIKVKAKDLEFASDIKGYSVPLEF